MRLTGCCLKNAIIDNMVSLYPQGHSIYKRKKKLNQTSSNQKNNPTKQ